MIYHILMYYTLYIYIYIKDSVKLVKNEYILDNFNNFDRITL